MAKPGTYESKYQGEDGQHAEQEEKRVVHLYFQCMCLPVQPYFQAPPGRTCTQLHQHEAAAGAGRAVLLELDRNEENRRGPGPSAVNYSGRDQGYIIPRPRGAG